MRQVGSSEGLVLAAGLFFFRLIAKRQAKVHSLRGCEWEPSFEGDGGSGEISGVSAGVAASQGVYFTAKKHTHVSFQVDCLRQRKYGIAERKKETAYPEYDKEKQDKTNVHVNTHNYCGEYN